MATQNQMNRLFIKVELKEESKENLVLEKKNFENNKEYVLILRSGRKIIVPAFKFES